MAADHLIPLHDAVEIVKDRIGIEVTTRTLQGWSRRKHLRTVRVAGRLYTTEVWIDDLKQGADNDEVQA